MVPKKVNLVSKFDLFKDHWNPRIVGELNGQSVKIAKLKGDFVRHKHDHEGELFMVIEGQLNIEFDTETVVLNAGEFIIVPKGVYHKPIAAEEVKVMLFEPATTLNTGDVDHEYTRPNLDRLIG